MAVEESQVWIRGQNYIMNRREHETVLHAIRGRNSDDASNAGRGKDFGGEKNIWREWETEIYKSKREAYEILKKESQVGEVSLREEVDR